MRSVFYDDREIEIVENGFESIKSVLIGEYYSAKERLLLCLDKYLDPWFGYSLPFERELYSTLEKELFTNNPLELKEDILQLLRDYCSCPLDYLKANIDKLVLEIQPKAKYIANME